jgi:hypothetical protein
LLWQQLNNRLATCSTTVRRCGTLHTKHVHAATQCPVGHASSSAGPSLHRSKTLEQSNSGFPNRTLTRLCSLQAQSLNPAALVTSGGCFASSLRRWPAHSWQG